MADLPNLSGDPQHAKGDEVNLRAEPEPEAIAAIDALAAAAVKAKNPPVKTPEELEAERVAAEKAKETPPAKTPEELEAERAAANPPVKAPEELEAERVAAEKAKETPPAKTPEELEAERAAANPPKDSFDEIELPPNTKSKSAEAFGRLKQAAREKVAEVAAQLTAAAERERKLVVELEAAKSSTGKLPPEIEKELTDLRAEHATSDIQNDPEIKKFDTTLQSNEEIIYKKLETSGVDSDAIAKIKELGGVEAVDWNPILEKLPVQVQRFIEATLIDNERTRNAKEEAIKSAKTNANEYTAKRVERESQLVTNTALDNTKKLPWLQLKEIPANATVEQKAAIDAENKSAQDYQVLLNGFLADRGPKQFAELAVGTTIAYRLQAQLKALSEQHQKATAGHTTGVQKLTQERDALKSQLDAIKRAQIPRNRGDTIIPPKIQPKIGDVSGAEALESLAKDVVVNRDE
jgi:hypothetical protein